MILGVNGRFLGARATGVQRFATEIIRRLWPRIEAGVLLLPAGARLPREQPEVVTTAYGHLRGHVWEWLELPAAARRFRCDVVLHPANSLPRRGGPHVVVVHDVEPIVRPEAFAPAFRIWYLRAVAPAVRRAARVVTVSRISADAIASVLQVEPARIRVADQGATPLDVPADPSAVAAVRRRFALPGPYLLAVGTGDPRKNVAFLHEMLMRWRGRRRRGDPLPPTPVLVGVNGGEAAIFATAGEERAPRGDVHLGRVDDATLRALYTGASALAFPSLGEGFGRPPLEALACGTPVVAAPYPAAREVLDDAAELVPLQLDAWVESLAAILDEGEEALALRRRRGRARAAAHSWDSGTSTVLQTCREVFEESTSARRGRPATRPATAAEPRPACSEAGLEPAFAPSYPGESSLPERPAPAAADPALADLRVALVHDWLTGMRGGERVLEALLELFPGADIFTLLHVPGSVTEAVEARRIVTSLVQRLPRAATHYRAYLPMFPGAVESFDLTGYDLVLSSSHCVAKGAVPPSGTPHLCYCHTPMRYVWDQMDAYLGPGRARPIARALAPALVKRLRSWDIASAARVTRFVANSQHVRERIRRCWGREAGVVHPPVAVERFHRAAPREDFYLVVSALVPYKRIDLAVRALRMLRRSLVVVGSGPELPRLRRLAGLETRFTGWVSDDEVAELMARCRALVIPGVEDFGMVPVEAQASGAPVIALGEGGAHETVVPGDGGDATGVFFHPATVEALVEAVIAFEKRSFDPASARRSALRFGKDRFLAAMRSEVLRLLEGEPVRPLAFGRVNSSAHVGRGKVASSEPTR